MKYLLATATAAVLALTSVSATGAECYQPDDTTLEVLPPPEYDKPFAGKLEEFIAKDQEELTSFCRGLSASVVGCARHWPASESGPPLCDIYLAPDELIRRRGLTTEIVRRHEIAHCNGCDRPAGDWLKSAYRSGRSPDWLKMKRNLNAPAIIYLSFT